MRALCLSVSWTHAGGGCGLVDAELPDSTLLQIAAGAACARDCMATPPARAPGDYRCVRYVQ